MPESFEASREGAVSSFQKKIAQIVENNSWGSFVILEQEKVKGGKNVKLMTLLGTTLFRIETRFVEAEVL
jgi:hypothetical protein